MKNVLFYITASLSIVGAIVGIGFVSGKEIISFFFKYEPISILFAVVACVLLFFVLFFVLKNSLKINNLKNKNRNNENKSDKNAYKYKLNRSKISKNMILRFGKIFNFTIGVLCLFTLGTMISGAENLLTLVSYGNKIIKMLFILFLIIFVAFVASKGDEFISYFSSASTFVLIIIMIINILLCVMNNGGNLTNNINNINVNFSLVYSGICSIVFYVSMNMLSCSGILANMKTRIDNKKQAFLISLFASFILFVLIFSILLVYKFNPSIVIFSMPLLELSKNVGNMFYYFYTAILFSGCIVAIISIAYSCKVYFKKCFKSVNFVFCVLVMCAGFLISLLGFDFLVDIVYPLIGLVYLLISCFKMFFIRYFINF